MVQCDCRMVFQIDNYLRFSSVVRNAVLFWELITLHNRWGGPQRITTSHFVVKFIGILPRTGNWKEVTWGLRQ